MLQRPFSSERFMKKLKKKKKARRGKVRYVRISKERMRQLEARARAAKRNPRETKKKKKSKARKASVRKPRKNMGPLLAALVEGAGFSAGSRALDAVTRKKRKSKAARRPKPRKIKRNPTHGVAVGSRSNPRFIAAGPKAQIDKLARALRSALGPSRNVMVGRVKTRGH